MLFKLNAGFTSVQFDQLHGLNPLDIALMALVTVTFLGLYPAFRGTRRVWSILAAAMPFLGILVFLATNTAGRSGVLGAGLIVSFLMLRSAAFGRGIGAVGLLANALLLAGDFSTMPHSQSSVVALFVGIGYMLLTAWFFWIGRKLFGLGHMSD